MSEHTPGPWVWMDVCENIPNSHNDGSHGYDGLFRDIDGTEDEVRILQDIQPLDDLPDDHHLVLKFGDRTSCGSIVIDNPADAILIAAAPDLLAAVNDLVAIFMDGSHYEPQNPYCRPAVKAALAAIAKATGKEVT